MERGANTIGGPYSMTSSNLFLLYFTNFEIFIRLGWVVKIFEGPVEEDSPTVALKISDILFIDSEFIFYMNLF